MARQVTGHPIPVEFGPRRAGDPAVLIADSADIRRELGWTPAHSELRNIITSAWAWHSRHPDGYGDS
jgi:UDP-glucose 4-epimerase